MGVPGRSKHEGAWVETLVRRMSTYREQRWALAAALSVAFGAQAMPAAAQSSSCPETPSRQAVGAAKAAFREGQLAFNEGDYGRAVELWQFAYAKDCTAHALLLNLATAQELAGQTAAAIDSLRLFNEREPGSDYELPNRRRIERLEQSLHPTPLAEPPPAPVAPALPPPPVVELAPPPAPAPPPVTNDAGEPRGRSLTPLVVAGAGAAVGVLGGILYANAASDVSAAADRCRGPRSSCADAQAVVDGEAARTRAQTAGWVLGAGLLTAAGGTLWYFLQPAPANAQSSARLGWAPALGPSGAELRVVGAF
jgi:hypothetical protein